MKLGLVLEGGAARTLFTCGVLDVLLEEKIYADYVIGVSAGISQGVSYVSRQKERNAIIARDYMSDKRYMGIRHMFKRGNRSYFNMDFICDEIPNVLVPFDYEAYESSNTEVIAGVTNVDTGEAEYVDAYGGDKTWKTLRATCALPLLFPIIRLGDKRYFDGGISDSIPFEKAFEDGCDKVIVVTTRARDYRKALSASAKLIASVYRKLPNFCDTFLDRPRMYNEQKEKLYKLEAEGKLFVIEPVSVMGVGRTEKRWEKLKPLYLHGKEAAFGEMAALRQYLRSE